MLKRLLLAIMLVCLAPAAFAGHDAKPQCLRKTIKADTPYGHGELDRLFIKIYDASLWTDADQWSMEEPYALSITYDVSIDGSDLVDRSMDEMQNINPIPRDKAGFYKEELSHVFPNVKKGDTITAMCDPENGLTFYLNNKETGHIKDLDLSERFMSIWLSPKTSEPKLRAALLNTPKG